MHPAQYPKFRLLLTIIMGLNLGQLSAASVDLVDVLDFKPIWSLEAAEFLNNVNTPGRARSFDWVSRDDRSEARFPKWKNSPDVEIWGMKLWEGLVRFEDGKPVRLRLSLYNKGDVEAALGPDGLINNKKEFQNFFAQIESHLKSWSRSKGSDRKIERLLNNQVKIRRRYWIKDPNYIAELKWSYRYGRTRKEFFLEYVNLDFLPLTKKNDPRIRRVVKSSEKRKSRPTAKGLAANIKRTVAGDVYIDNVPMVDQGAKGYCAVAAVERILRYYGSEFDQHVIAQMAKSSARGTQLDEMMKVLRKTGSKLGVKVRVHYDTEPSYKYYQTVIKNYNRVAKRAKQKKIGDEDWIARSGNQITYRVDDLYRAFDWELYKKYRLNKDKTKYRRFLADVRKYVDTGVPLTWSVLLGKIQEPGLRQTHGWHMRMIIGYNDKTNELVYTDTWGPGHEFKKMNMDDAWSITFALGSLVPRLR